MKIAMIAAMAKDRIIGADNEMPWHLPADLRHFKQVTMGKPVIMGRKTYQSIGKALPGRLNIVISTQADYYLDYAVVVASPEAAIDLATEHKSDEVMIIGGGSIYGLFLPLASELYLTFIDTQVDGDTRFPDYESAAQWQQISCDAHEPDDRNPYHYQFVKLERV